MVGCVGLSAGSGEGVVEAGEGGETRQLGGGGLVAGRGDLLRARANGEVDDLESWGRGRGEQVSIVTGEEGGERGGVGKRRWSCR